MPIESVEGGLRQLLVQTKESPDGDYETAEVVNGETLDGDVRLKLVAGGHSANLEESLEATIRKGGGVGESIEQMLIKTGMTGWT